ncbi:hypothetical protein [Roseixanthobacter glucoisosaccharinicivorans]|uniref:hypothetical protein n=1 Tax=Roseixanthobacter glucoisosaccharinicivorans TaxID=3119923 RepID=UPI00372CBCBE
MASNLGHQGVPYTPAKELQFAYGDWVSDKVEQGYQPFFMSFMFHPLTFSLKAKKIDQMHADIERIYSRIITRFARRPNSHQERHKLPLMLVAPDLPVPKHTKVELNDVTLNDGLHCHAIFLQPPVSRFRERFHLWATENNAALIRDTRVRHMWVGRVFVTPDRMTQYALKAVGTRLSSDSLLLLPRERNGGRDTTARGYDEACRREGGSSLMRTGWKPF